MARTRARKSSRRAPASIKPTASFPKATILLSDGSIILAHIYRRSNRGPDEAFIFHSTRDSRARRRSERIYVVRELERPDVDWREDDELNRPLREHYEQLNSD